MMENIKIFASDKYWNRILTDLGASMVDSPENADIVFDEISPDAPISVADLQQLILDQYNNSDILQNIFGCDVNLPLLQRKIIVALYKKPNIQIHNLKTAVGLSPDATTHSVENAIYQLRKTFGHNFILNENGGYRIGRI